MNINKFIVLTSPNGKQIYLNIDHIMSFHEDLSVAYDAYTVVNVDGGDSTYYRVKETPQQIDEQITDRLDY